MAVSWNGGTPKWTVYDGKSHWNGWFRGTPTYGNSQMVPEALELWVTQGMDPRSSRTSVQSTLQKAGRCRVQMSTVPSVLPLVRRQASLLEGSLEVKLPTIWTDGKEEVGRVTEEKRREEKESGERVRRKSQEKESGERVRRKSQEKESGERVRRKSQEKESEERVRRKSQKKESEERKAQAREKVEKSRFTLFFRWCVGPEGRKVGSLKRRARSHLARWEMINCTPLWREAHFQVKMCKTPHVRTTFGSWDGKKVHAVVARSIFPSQMYKTHHARATFGRWDVEKVHAVVARSTCGSQKCKELSVSEHFLKSRCRKSARRCGVKHMSNSICEKHTTFRPLLDVYDTTTTTTATTTITIVTLHYTTTTSTTTSTPTSTTTTTAHCIPLR